MKESTKSRINFGILLFGAALAATIAPGVGATAAITGILTYLGRHCGKPECQIVGDLLDDVPKDQQDIFRNHHLRTLIAEAAALVVAKVIAKNPASVTGTLTATLKDIGPALDKAMSDPKSPLAKLDEFNLPDLLTEFAKKGKMQLLSIEVWEAFLSTLPQELWPEERRSIAEALYADFGGALWGIVKDNAAKDGEAAAAIEILYLSRLLEATKQTAKSDDIALLTSRIASRIARLDQLATKHFRTLFARDRYLQQTW